MKNIIQLLKKPFPEMESNAAYFKTVTAVSIFVFLFLYIFSPFDMSNLQSNNLLICFGFGVMTFLATIIYDFGIRPIFRLITQRSNLTFGKWILNMMGTMLMISLANFIYMRLIIFGTIRWEFFHYMLRNTLAIGIFPVVTLGAISLLRQEKKYQTISEEINQKKNKIPNNILTNNVSIFDIPTSQIRYVEALQNYVKIGHLNSEGQLIEKTERATLKSILNKTNGCSIVRCHRSFLVNEATIISTSGNAQGLLLSLSNCEKTIPVSRSYVPVFKKNGS